ncbi:hypothetical protein [Fulvivirga sp.]|uniref:hypothetical protein n=1 Tax=Fulvivirga sp. TaxID=1931237 RepID=UPI0032EB3F06
MKKIILILLLAIPVAAFSQGSEDVRDANFINRVYTGGNIGFQMDAFRTTAEVSPIIGYRITNEFSLGIGLTYIYYKYEDSYTDFETNIYGYRMFGRYNITHQFFLLTEYESLSLEFLNDGTENRQWVPGAFVGGGFYQSISDNAGFNIAVLYNVMFDELRSPYKSPLVYRVGFTVGF